MPQKTEDKVWANIIKKNVENQCRKYGLKYFALELDICPFIKNPFKSKEDILNPQTQPFVEDIQKELEAIEEKKNKEAISYDIFSDEEVIDNE